MATVGLLLVAAALQVPPPARATYELALQAQRRGEFLRSDSIATAALHLAVAQRDDATAARSAALVAEIRSRTRGPRLALNYLDSTTGARVVPPGGARAMLDCTRASLLVQLGDTTALRLADAGVRHSRVGKDVAEEARCHLIAARYFERRGAIDSTGGRLTKALAMQRAVGDRHAAATTLQWMGYVHLTVYALGAARARLEEAIVEGRVSGNASAVAWATMNLGGYSGRLGDRERAQERYDEAERLFAQQGDRQGLLVLRGMMNAIAISSGDPDAAERRASEDRPVEPQARFHWHDSRARIAGLRGDWTRARAELDSAAAAGAAGGMPGWTAGLGRSRVRAALRAGDLDGAERLLSEWRSIREQPARVYVRNLFEAELLARRGRVDSAEARLRRAATEFDTWWRSLPDESLRLLAFEATDALGARATFAATAAVLVRAGRARAVLELAEARQARELVFRLARTRATGGSRATAPRIQGSLDDALRRILPDDRTALVEFIAGVEGTASVALAATRSGVVGAVIASMDSLLRDVSALRTLAADGADVRPLGRRLGGALLDPLLAQLPPGVDRLAIVPDDDLHHVPFDALVLADGRFVVERFAVALVPSALVAADLVRPEPRRPRILAFGAPTFAEGVAALPRSGAEARAVGSRAPGSRVWSGSRASESALKRERLTDYSIVHFATHAETDDQSLARNALLLSAGNGEDGRVEPGELLALTLDADLVVLSACRSAVGIALSGQGVWGLTGPLLASGARTVVATSWDVGDRAAERFIGELYGRLRTQSVIDALRETKLASLRRGESASRWAAFTLTGSPHGRVAVP